MISVRSKGKYSKINARNPLALGRCDLTGFVGRRQDFVPQMEYRGLSLIPTGFLVIPKFLDKPNAQSMNPTILPDPYPIRNPRPGTRREDE